MKSAAAAVLTLGVVALGAVAARPEGLLSAALFAALVGGLLAPRTAARGLRAASGDALHAVALGTLVEVLLANRFGGVPTPFAAGAVLAGAHLSARSLARLMPNAAPFGAAFCAALVVVATGVPDLFGNSPAVFARVDPSLGAVVLDAVPMTLLAESAGLDWMRHPSVYAPAGTDWFSDRRAPFDGSLAAVTALVVGCALSAAAIRRRSTTTEDR